MRMRVAFRHPYNRLGPAGRCYIIRLHIPSISLPITDSPTVTPVGLPMLILSLNCYRRYLPVRYRSQHVKLLRFVRIYEFM